MAEYYKCRLETDDGESLVIDNQTIEDLGNIGVQTDDIYRYRTYFNRFTSNMVHPDTTRKANATIINDCPVDLCF